MWPFSCGLSQLLNISRLLALSVSGAYTIKFVSLFALFNSVVQFKQPV